MANRKLTALTEEVVLNGNDLFYVVTDISTTPASQKVSMSTLMFNMKNLATVGFDSYYTANTGWAEHGLTWTYASATSFTVAGNLTALFRKGTKIMLFVDGTTRYFYVTNSAYGAPNTTVTITGGSDYSLTNFAISDTYYSYVENPANFPEFFNWNPTLTGWSTVPPDAFYQFRIMGSYCELHVRQVSAGSTSDTTTVILTAPVTSANVANQLWGVNCFGQVDNSVNLTATGRATITNNTTTINVYTNMYNGAWTNSGTKSVNFDLVYQI